MRSSSSRIFSFRPYKLTPRLPCHCIVSQTVVKDTFSERSTARLTLSQLIIITTSLFLQNGELGVCFACRKLPGLTRQSSNHWSFPCELMLRHVSAPVNYITSALPCLRDVRLPDRLHVGPHSNNWTSLSFFVVVVVSLNVFFMNSVVCFTKHSANGQMKVLNLYSPWRRRALSGQRGRRQFVSSPTNNPQH